MTTPDETYWAYCAKGELRMQQCGACSAWSFPPVERCTSCQEDRLVWQPVAGSGTLWSWVRFHKAYFQEAEFEVPYLVAMVELDEGIRMITALQAADGGRADDTTLVCGDPVEVVFPPRSGTQRRLPRVRPATRKA